MTRPILMQSAAHDQVRYLAERKARNRVRVIVGCVLATVLVAAALLAYELRGVLLLFAVVAVPALAYWASLRLRPYRACSRCDGTGKVGGLLFRQARAFCIPCGGTGLVPRFGTRFLSQDHRPPDRTGAKR